MTMKRISLVLAVVASFAATGCRRHMKTLRVAYSPNLPHAAALVGVASGRFTKAAGVAIQTSVYNAGPAEIEALLYHDIDIAYVGPVPALAAYARSKGRCQIVAGAAEGGAALVAAKLSAAQSPKDLHSMRVATPQAGNTQDVAARSYFGELGFTSYEHGGNFRITPAANADLLSMFQSGAVQAAWTVEPWATQLIDEAGGTRLLDESTLWAVAPATGSYPTAVLIARESLIKDHPEVLDAFLRLHAETTAWMNENPVEAQRIAESAISRLTHRSFAPGVIARAWARMNFSTEVSRDGLERNADNAARVGFLSAEPVEMDKLIRKN